MGKIITQEERINRFNLKHKNFYLYDRMVYMGPREKIEIGCPIHGYFWQSCATHMKGAGCRECANQRMRDFHLENNLKKIEKGEDKVVNLQTFLIKARKVHGDKFDYSKVVYRGINFKVTIICPIHGEFETSAHSHISGYDCRKCSFDRVVRKNIESKKKSGMVTDTESFVLEAPNRQTFSGVVYDYSKTKYTSSKEPVTITCPIHGDFRQSPDKHLSGKGCRKCRIKHSIIENKVKDILDRLNVKYRRNEMFQVGNKKLELDFYTEDLKIGIEVNGTYTHSEALKKDYRTYHKTKREFFNSLGIRVIFIWEDEIKYNKTTLESYLQNIFSKSNSRIFARKCELVQVGSKEGDAFLNSNHILKQSGKQKTYLALKNKGEIVCLMTFNQTYGKQTLTRMVNKKFTNVVGGFSKLLQHWRRENPQEDLISFIDLDKFEGGTYFKSGFMEDGMGQTMWYVKRDRRESKHKFRKNKLRTMFKNYDENLTEKENCKNNHIYQVWNSGTMRVKLPSIL